MRIKIIIRPIFIVLGAAVLLAAGLASPASALVTRANTYTFGSAGTESSTINNPRALAFSQSTKSLYSTTESPDGIFGFNATTPGTYTPLAAFNPKAVAGTPGYYAGLAVDNTGAVGRDGNVYFSSNNASKVWGWTSAGAPLPAFTELDPVTSPAAPIGSPASICAVGVDPSGNVWVGNNATQYLIEYDPNGNYVKAINAAALEKNGGPCGITFDPANGDMYLLMQERSIWKLAAPAYNVETAAQFFKSENGCCNPHFIAFNGATHHVFFTRSERVVEYDSSGNLVRTFGEGIVGASYIGGVAVNEATDEVYVGDAGNKEIRVFSPAGIVPDITSEPAANVTRTSTDIEGHAALAGGGNIQECKVEYGLTEKYGSSTGCNEAMPLTVDVPVTAHLTGLASQSTYHFRIKVRNSIGPNYSADRIFTTQQFVLDTTTTAATEVTESGARLTGSFNADGIGTTYYFEYGPTTSYNQKFPAPPGANGGNAGVVTPVSQVITGLEPGTSPAGTEYNYRLVAVNSLGTSFGENQVFHTLPAVKGLSTLSASQVHVDPQTQVGRATLNGTVTPAGEATHYYFEWGKTNGYGSFAPSAPPGPSTGAGVTAEPVSVLLTGLEVGVTYHYRLVATNGKGKTIGADETVVPTEVPTLTAERAAEVNTDTARLRASINPESLATTYFWEYGLEDCAIAVCVQSAEASVGKGISAVAVGQLLDTLVPGAQYHFRLVAENARGTVVSGDHHFTTYSRDSGVDKCANILVRKQTGAGLAPHCRAYELVSANDTAGYDVESNLITGLSPEPGFPRADDRVLYTVRFGAIPGSGNPPNRGGDPYLATRTETGWVTKYVGLQANLTPSALPFSSSVLEADRALDSFAFGGPDTCNPCFGDGSQNIPVRLPDGILTKGMAGSLSAAGVPVGEIAKRFSGDGRHFIFGSAEPLELTGNEGSLSIYERDLDANTTQVVSTMPNGSTMPGPGTVELDVSHSGDRVLIGRLVGTDAVGNPRYDLYMHVGDSPESVPVAETANGVLYSGMSADGAKVFFTTADSLAGDSDAGADLFRADVTPTAATVTRVSTGSEGTGDVNGCSPVSNSSGNHWNEPGNASPGTCGVVAIAGGGGVASESGAVFFLSPEKLDGASNGVADRPNLYKASPGGAPVFIATLEPNNLAVRRGVGSADERDSSDFQVTPNGSFSVFTSSVSLTGAANAGYIEIYRSNAGGGVDCVSCTPTNAEPSTDTQLTGNGLNLVDDGRVFFTSAEQLVLRDTNQLKDAYEWDGGQFGLISSGLDTNDSGLLTATANGRDAFFFTRQTLVPQDENGGQMKIYDAREGGGFLINPPPHPCVASDECHGPGSRSVPSAPINTIEGTEEPQSQKKASCRRGSVRRHGRCIKKAKRKHRKGHRHG